MSGKWSRRALLASIGTGLVAGCRSDGQPAGTPTRSPGPVGTPTQTPTTGPQTDTPTDTATDAATESTSLPDPETPSSVDSNWPMPNADSGRSNGIANAAGPTDPIGELWTVSADATLSAPVLANETVYLGDEDGTVRSFDARTGDGQWRTSVGASATVPWVLDETLYVPTAGEIVALATVDGTEQWRASTPSRAEILAASHGIYWLAEGEPSVVVGLNRNDGSERWRTEYDHCDQAPPYMFAGSDAVYVSSDTHADVPWKFAAETGELQDGPSGCGADFAGERFYRDGTIYAADGFFGRIQATPIDDEEGWDTGLPGGKHFLCGDSDRVYVDVNSRTDPVVSALDVSDGREKWRIDGRWTTVSRPVVAGETLLVNTEETLRCFDPANGTERWTKSSERIGDQIAVADDLVYTTTGDTVRCFRSVESGV